MPRSDFAVYTVDEDIAGLAGINVFVRGGSIIACQFLTVYSGTKSDLLESTFTRVVFLL